MALYLRLLGTDPVSPKINIHQFQAIICEWARGQINATQGRAAIAIAGKGVPLTPAEEIEAQTLVSSVPTGGTTANQLARLFRLLEIDHVLLLVDMRIPPYSTEAAIKTRLGV